MFSSPYRELQEEKFTPYQPPRLKRPYDFLPTNSQQLANHLSRLSFECHIILARGGEAFSSKVFDWASWLLGAPGHPIQPDGNAILILGASEGIGRDISLKFAEWGYTVFACVPSEVETGSWQPTLSSPPFSSSASSLLYIWQNKKQRSQETSHPSSGTIIPLTFDPSSREDRIQAVETVQAYTSSHNLHLCSIVLSPPYNSSDSLLDIDRNPSNKDEIPGRFIPLALSNPDIWADTVRRGVIEPLLVVQDFLRLLKPIIGRIVVLSGCAEANFYVAMGSHSPCDAARKAMARTLHQELMPLGINVSLVVTGPLARRTGNLANLPPQPIEKDTVVGASQTPLDNSRVRQVFSRQTKISRFLAKLSSFYAIDDDTVCSIVRRAVESRYPKPSYHVGLDLFVQHLMSFLIPENAWALMGRAIDPDNKDPPEQSSSNVGAAIARSLSRGLAIYFARPVRLFRPSKLSSGWTSLRTLASRDGTSLTPQYMTRLIKTEGLLVIPRHFLPPLIINTLLGTVLFTTYSEASHQLQTNYTDWHPVIISAASGAIAGGVQAVVAAPAENVRIILQGYDGTHPPVRKILLKHKASKATPSWGSAWKEVFQGADPLAQPKTRGEMKEIRNWMNEVKGMAGRGWDGWGWGTAKDIVGFGLFFAVFELSRTAATEMALWSAKLSQRVGPMTMTHRRTVNAARLIQGVTLVTGGVIAGLGYELVCRPFDGARRIVNLVLSKIREEGLIWFFRSQTYETPIQDTPGMNRHIWAAVRTLARVGPWGVGFLIFEGMGGGLGPVPL